MQDFLREEVLRLTSDLRLSLERLCHEPADGGALARARRAGRALAETGAQARLRALSRCGRAFEENLAADAHAIDAEVARRAFAGMHGAVGLVEQMLEWSLEGSDEPRQERLFRATSEALKQAPLVAPPGGAPGVAGEDPQRAEPTPTTTTPAAQTDFEREMLQVFSAEAAERLAQCEQLLLRLEPDPGNAELLQEVLREFHTLKSAAAAAGLRAVAEQLHTGESVIDAVARGAKVLDGGKLVDLLLKLVDATKAKLREGRATEPSADLSLEIARILEPTARATGTRAADMTSPEVDTGVVRVESNRLTALMQEVGELVASGTDLDQQVRSLTELREKLGPGELSEQLGTFIQSLQQRAQQLTRITSGLKEQVSHLQFLPLEVVFRRLLRPARDAAREEGKLVEIQFAGGDLRLDRSVVEALYAPLLHLVRNSVAHGFESAEQRQSARKPEAGCLRISAAPHDQGWIAVSVQDDGRGLDLTRILAKARARGLVAPDATPAREEICRLVFRPGFSTRDAVSEISGRGVGLDVVEKRVAGLGGAVQVETAEGAGTTVRLVVPISSQRLDVIVLAVGKRLYAVPSEVVAETVPVAIGDLESAAGGFRAQIDGHRVVVHALGPALGQPLPAEEGEIVVLRTPEAAVALLVDAARDHCEITVRPLTRQEAARPLVVGVAHGDAGDIELLDLDDLLGWSNRDREPDGREDTATP